VHKFEIANQLGIENSKRLEKLILSEEIYLPDCLFKEINFLMEQFPEYDFVIKPGRVDWFSHFKDIENLIQLYAIRHPKIALATSYDKNTNIDEFTDKWIKAYKILIYYSDLVNVIKLEDIKNNKLMKSLIKNTNVERPYTNYDINDYRLGIFNLMSKFEHDLKTIELKLKDFLNYLNYELEDLNTKRYLEELCLIQQK
jgi:hypothetical protein